MDDKPPRLPVCYKQSETPQSNNPISTYTAIILTLIFFTIFMFLGFYLIKEFFESKYNNFEIRLNEKIDNLRRETEIKDLLRLTKQHHQTPIINNPNLPV